METEDEKRRHPLRSGPQQDKPFPKTKVLTPDDSDDVEPLIKPELFDQKESLLARREDAKSPTDFKTALNNLINESISDSESEAKYKFPDADACDQIVIARSVIVKDIHRALTHELSRLNKEFEHELLISRDNVFPRKWMIEDSQIKMTMKRCPLLMPLIDYLFNQNRRIKKEKLKELQEMAQHQTHNGHPVSCFLTDAEFYRQTAKALNCSEGTIKRYIKNLVDANLLHPLFRLEHNVRVIKDGFYTPFIENKLRKQSLIKDNAFCRDALRNFRVVQVKEQNIT